MADSPDITKQILIQVATNQEQVSNEIQSLNGELDKLLVQQLKLKGSSEQNSTAYIKLQSDIRNTRQAIRDKNRELDNSNKAFKAEANSIQQNRALLSALTAQYVKLSQEEGKTAQSTLALGKQISALSAKLTEQEKAIGQGQRSVGKYEEAMRSVIGQIGGKFIPGFGQLSSIIGTSARSFGKMSAEAEGAEAATEGLAGGAVALGGALALAAAAAVGVAAYFKNVATVSDNLSGAWAGTKAGFDALISSIRNGDFSNLIDNVQSAITVVGGLTKAMLKLNREMLAASVQSNSENQFIQTQMLKLRNIHTTASEAEKIFKEIQDTSERQYERTYKLATEGFNNTAAMMSQTAQLTKQEYEKLLSDGIVYAEQLKQQGKKFTDDELAQLANFQNQQISAQGIRDQRDQRAQNREEQRISKEQAAAEKQRELQAEITRQIEAENEARQASYAKTAQPRMEAFGKELSQTDEHYRKLIFKEEQFISKQQEIQNNPKNSAKTRALAGKAISVSRGNILQIQKEHYGAIEEALINHNRMMIDEAEKAGIDLQKVVDENIINNKARAIAGINDQFAAEKQVLSVNNAQLEDTIRRLNKEIATPGLSNDELTALRASLDTQYALLSDNADKEVALERRKNQQIKDINDQFNEQQIAYGDAANVASTSSPSNPNSKANYLARRQQIIDESQRAQDEAAKQNVAGQPNEALASAHADGVAKLQDLDEGYRKSKRERDLQYAQMTTDAAFSIVENSIKAETANRMAALELQKDTELKNTALTTTQKAMIDERTRKKEQQIKRQEFFAEQKEGIAKAAINGAIAVLKAAPDVPLEILTAAETALQIAVIAKQQPPPAYATGGYISGKGSGKSDSIIARVSNGESVINANSTSMFAPLLSAINVAGGGIPFSTPNFTGKFATGGLVNGANYIPTAATGLHPVSVSARISGNDIQGIADAVGRMKIYTDVKDINYQQGVKANVDNRTVL